MPALTALTTEELRDEIASLREIEREARGITVNAQRSKALNQACAERAELEAELRAAGATR
jgi:hypothetical protein